MAFAIWRVCLALQKCPFGTACKYAHGHFELWLHPGRFRTKMCSLGANCKRPVCFFAHSEQELRTTPYCKLDTAASVAAQQLADLGQDLDISASRSGASLAGNSCGSIAGDIKIRPGSSIASPGSSECGAARHIGSSSNSPSNSLSVEDAAALAKLTASMAALRPAPLLDVGGMARLQNGAYLAAAAAVDASLSGSADVSLSGSAGLWPLAGAGVLQQPGAAVYANGPFLQQQPVPMLDPQLLAGGAAAPGGDVWLMAAGPAAPWPAVSAAAAARSMLAQQQRAYAHSAAPPAAPCTGGLAPGIPIPHLMGPAALGQWLPLDGLQGKDGCYTMQAGLCAPQAVGCSMVQQQQQAAADGSQQVMQQLLNQQAMQQLLGLLDAQAAH
jgi:hypothetical protein